MMAFLKKRMYEVVLGFFVLALLSGALSIWVYQPRVENSVDKLSLLGKLSITIVVFWTIGFLTHRLFPDE